MLDGCPFGAMFIGELIHKEMGFVEASYPFRGVRVGRVNVSGPVSGTETSKIIRDELPVGIVAEKRRINHPWQEFKWLPVAVVPGAGETTEWIKIAEGEGFVQHLIATLPVSVFRMETEAYKMNLSCPRPSVYVVLRMPEEAEDPEIRAVFATVSPYEAQDHLDSGVDILEAVPMPEAMQAWLQNFVDMHHVDEPFKKRKRKDHREDPAQFGKVLHPVERRFYDVMAGRGGIELETEHGDDAARDGEEAAGD